MKDHLINSHATIVEALDALNRLSGSTMVLFVTDGDGRLMGSLTDGDVRRALLAGNELKSEIAGICKKDCLSISKGKYEALTLSKARKLRIRLLPVVEDGFIVGLLDLNRRRGLVPADGVLMAGGAGERLRPLTATVPKPLLPVGGEPILNYNINLFREFGIDNIFVTVNYLKQQITDHVEGEYPGVSCIEEPRRLGTIGSLSLIKDFRSPNVVVMNADLLTDINLEAMYLRHLDTEAWLTMAVVPYTVSVPFAIVSHQGDSVKGLTEKPTFNYYANAGIYMMRREVAQSVPQDTFMDATDLVERLIAEGKRVSLYNIDGRWIDIGSPDDYRHACELMGS